MMTILAGLFLVAGLLVLCANIGVLWIVIKLYTEMLKIGHIKNIGKVA